MSYAYRSIQEQTDRASVKAKCNLHFALTDVRSVYSCSYKDELSDETSLTNDTDNKC